MAEEALAANIGESETPVADSAPVEQTTPETDIDVPVAAETAPPVEEEKTVPLSALIKEREARKQAEENAKIFTEINKKGKDAPASSPADGPFDEETARNLEAWYAKKRAEEFTNEQIAKSSAFKAKHEEELKDPLLDAMVRKVILDGNSIGKIVDQEDALVIAKSALEARLQPAEAKAKESGFNEGQEIALKKTQAGAVGETSVKAPPVNPDDLSAAEYLALSGLPRAD